MRRRSAAHAFRRIRQSATAFERAPMLMATLALGATPLRLREVTFRVRRGPSVVTPNLPGARFPVYEVFVDDVYDMDALVAGLDGSFGVVDCGGQVGSFALAVAIRCPKAKIDTYEASPSTATYLRRNVHSNRLEHRVRVHGAAITGEAGTFEFFDAGNASAHNGLTSPDVEVRRVSVPAVALEDALSHAPAPVRLVKLDIEGAEYEAILNCNPVVWEDVQRVVMEYHPMADHSVEELQKYFSAIGLDTIRVEPGRRPGLGSLWLARGRPSS